MPLRVFIAGQRSFGAAVYKAVKDAGHTVTGVACPGGGQYYDRLKKAAWCDPCRPAIIDADRLSASDIPEKTDVLVAAHSHHFISDKVRAQVRYAIGYHPSLLPRHRGRDAVKWAIRFGDTVTGGSIYLLDDKVDGGPVLCQESVLIRRGWTDKELWREALFPLGVRLMLSALGRIESGSVTLTPQDDNVATWEPPIIPARLHRPELIMIE